MTPRPLVSLPTVSLLVACPSMGGDGDVNTWQSQSPVATWGEDAE